MWVSCAEKVRVRHFEYSQEEPVSLAGEPNSYIGYSVRFAGVATVPKRLQSNDPSELSVAEGRRLGNVVQSGQA